MPPASWPGRQSSPAGRDRRLVEVAASDAGLIGDDENMPSGLGRVADRVPSAVDPLEAVSRADIAVIDVEDAVAVKEQGSALQQRRDFGLRAGEILRHADIAEVAVPQRSPQAASARQSGQDIGLQRARRL